MSLKWATVNSFVGNFSSPALTSYRLCPVCGSMEYRVVLEFGDFQFFSDSIYNPKRVNIRQNQCLNCFTLYLNPCYSGFAYEVLFEEAGQSYVSDGSNRHQEQIEWLRSKGLLRDEVRVMDVGCYDGRFLAKMPGNISKIGVDIDRGAIDNGEQKFAGANIEFICGDFETFQNNKQPDIITMFHVLEHLPKPLSVLSNLRNTSKDSTKLIVEVPILENSETNDINGFFSVQHMTHFSRASLKNCFKQAGWKILEWDEQPGYNGCRIIATPSSTAAEIEINAHDFFLSLQYLATWYKGLGEVELKLETCNKINQFIIWGGGLHTEFLYQTTSFFRANPARQYLIVDSDTMKHGKSWRGIQIMHPSLLSGLNWTGTKLIISSYGSQKGIENAAIEMGVPPECIVKLYDKVRVY
jgi:hypothetical protein